jgi:tetratricopeptide (TPR) repeat protein
MRRYLVLFLVLAFTLAAVAQQDRSKEADALFAAGKRLEALPLYEQLVKDNPNDMLFAEHLADCYLAKAVQLDDKTQKDEIIHYQTLARDAAKKAITLGDKLVYIQMIADTDPKESLKLAPESIASDLLNEGEKLYTAGNYQAAFEKYTAAVELDPKLYLAALYAGDVAFTQHDLSTSSKWFARAISIDPDRETAYRYWGDAIERYGSDPMGAREKYIQAIIAEPYSRLAWQGVKQWAELENAIVIAPKIDRPAGPTVDPNNPKNVNITLDALMVNDKKSPGASAWVTYSIIRASYHGDLFKKNFPNEKEYRHTLKEESAALSEVAATVKEKKIKPEKLDESLRNLVMLHDAGVLDCWILISAADNGIAQDYEAYRKEHRQLLHDYLDKYVVHPANAVK